MKPLSIYGHMVSQPTRAVVWALKMKNVPHQFIEVDPSKGATRAPEFAQKFPLRTIPALEDENLQICESNAILSYLADKYCWNDWYPKDLVQRAKVNEYLFYHVTGTRKCTSLYFAPCLFAALFGRPIPEVSSNPDSQKEFKRVLHALETWLSQHKFLTSDQLTLADIACYCEIDQLLYGKLFSFQEYPHILRWIEEMKQLPCHDEVRKPLERICGFLEKKRKETSKL